MANSNHYPVRELSPKVVSYFMLIVGLIAIVVSVISQNLLIAASIISFPIILIYTNMGKPDTSFWLFIVCNLFVLLYSHYAV